MPRKSAASLSIITPGAITATKRPDPPSELTEEQSAEWRAVVDRLPADWFQRETWGLLTQYCRHVVAARRVAELIAGSEGREDFDIEEYDRLLKMQEREGRAMSSLATRMRISQQSSYDPKKTKPKGNTKNPWDHEG